MRRLARFHPPGALPGEGDADMELAALRKIAFHGAEPLGESIGIVARVVREDVRRKCVYALGVGLVLEDCD